jgi:hypothetical protein
MFAVTSSESVLQASILEYKIWNNKLPTFLSL